MLSEVSDAIRKKSKKLGTRRCLGSSPDQTWGNHVKLSTVCPQRIFIYRTYIYIDFEFYI